MKRVLFASGPPLSLDGSRDWGSSGQKRIRRDNPVMFSDPSTCKVTLGRTVTYRIPDQKIEFADLSQYYHKG
jgi:hypothetical protein